MIPNFCLFLKNQKLAAAYVQTINKGKYVIQPLNSAQIKISQSQVLYSWFDPSSPLDEGAQAYLQQKVSIFMDNRHTFDLKALYDLIETEKPYEFVELADLCVDKNDPELEWKKVELFSQLYQETYLFREKKGLFLARSPENIALIKLEEQKKADQSNKSLREKAWLDSLRLNQMPADSGSEQFDRFLNRLEKFVFYMQSSQEKEYFQQFFPSDFANPYSVEYEVCQILRQAGRKLSWGQLRVKRSEMDNQPAGPLADSFAKFAQNLQNFENLRNLPPTPYLDYFRDERHLEVYTIDNATTDDFDDAISFTVHDKGMTLACHISAIGLWLPEQTELFAWAEKRISSLYTLKQVYPMLPSILSVELFSLKAGQVRPSMTMRWEINQQSEITSQEIYFSWIQVKANWTYDHLNNLLANEPGDWQKVLDFGQVCHQKRLKNHAIEIPRTEVILNIENPNEIKIQGYRLETPASRLIQELAILSNATAGEYFKTKQVPGLFRGQEPPERRTGQQPIQLDNAPPSVQNLILRPARLSTVAKTHAGLGLEAYIQVTSPIRRFGDLVSQSIMADLLINREPRWRETHLEYWILKIEKQSKELQYLEKDLEFHWKLKYLAQNSEKHFTARYQRHLHGDLALVNLLEVQLFTELRIRKVPENGEITVKIIEIDISRHFLRLNTAI